MSNIAILYQYRDGSNWKESTTVVFDNPENVKLEAIEAALYASLDDNEFFVAEKVGLPTCYFDGGNDSAAHGLHELLSVKETDEEPSEASNGRTIGALAVEFARCNLRGWEPVRKITQEVSHV